MTDPAEAITGQAPEQDVTAKTGGWIWRRLLPLGILVLAILAVFVFGLDDYLSFDTLAAHRKDLMILCEEHGFLAIALFVAIYTAVIALSLPGAVWLSIAGGFLFGTVPAMIYNVVGATLGAVLIFLLARYALADFFHAKVGGHLRKMEKDFQENAFNYLLVLRLVPLFPFWLVNLVPALLNVKLRTYVVATLTGIIPGSYVFSSVGNGAGALIDRGEAPDVGVIFSPDILVPLIGLAVLSLIPVIYKKMKSHGQNA